MLGIVTRPARRRTQSPPLPVPTLPVPIPLLTCGKLRPLSRLLAVCLDYSGGLSQSEYAAVLGVSRRAIQSSIYELVRYGYVAVVSRSTKGTNRYFLLTGRLTANEGTMKLMRSARAAEILRPEDLEAIQKWSSECRSWTK